MIVSTGGLVVKIKGDGESQALNLVPDIVVQQMLAYWYHHPPHSEMAVACFDKVLRTYA